MAVASLDHMQVCTSLQTDNHTSTPPLKFFTGRMPFLPPNQQRQSTEGTPFVYHFSLIFGYLTYCYGLVKDWKEVVREDCQARKLNKEDAMDRCKWRKMIKEAR